MVITFEIARENLSTNREASKVLIIIYFFIFCKNSKLQKARNCLNYISLFQLEKKSIKIVKGMTSTCC